MPAGEEWLLRPTLAGALRYESLLDGTVGLEDVALLNDALDMQAENEARVQEALRQKD